MIIKDENKSAAEKSVAKDTAAVKAVPKTKGGNAAVSADKATTVKKVTTAKKAAKVATAAASKTETTSKVKAPAKKTAKKEAVEHAVQVNKKIIPTSLEVKRRPGRPAKAKVEPAVDSAQEASERERELALERLAEEVTYRAAFESKVLAATEQKKKEEKKAKKEKIKAKKIAIEAKVAAQKAKLMDKKLKKTIQKIVLDTLKNAKKANKKKKK